MKKVKKLDEYIIKSGKKLRLGYTTGSCATASAKAAAMMLMEDKVIENLKLILPGGKEFWLDIEDISREENSVTCCVVKDAGDDPDATDGIKIYAKVKKIPDGMDIDGGLGVGRVTKAGLALEIGEAAINPIPRKMLEAALKEVSLTYNYKGGFKAEIFVPLGEEVSKNTFNPRLGIMGGISILGTTGIVEPMSKDALVETIKLEIDSRKKAEDNVLFVAPGNYGLDFAKENFDLNIDWAVKCSNYIGEALDYALYIGFEKILLIGHVGKIAKIAAGVMDTHSKTADCRNEVFLSHASLCGANLETLQKIMEANTTDEIHTILTKGQVAKEVYASILKKIIFHLNYRTKNKIQIELVVFSNKNGLLMKTDEVEKFIDEIKERKN